MGQDTTKFRMLTSPLADLLTSAGVRAATSNLSTLSQPICPYFHSLCVQAARLTTELHDAGLLALDVSYKTPMQIGGAVAHAIPP